MISPATLRTSFSFAIVVQSFSRGLQLVSLSVAVLSFSSCSSGSGPKLPAKRPCIKVTGQVRVDGEPAEGVSVTLHPTHEDHGLYNFPNGMTNSDGEFKLNTYGKEDGAPAGDYVAVFIWPIPIDEQVVDDDDRLKRLYKKPRDSKFKVTIDGSEVTLDPFDLKLKGLEGIPLTKAELREIRLEREHKKVADSN